MPPSRASTTGAAYISLDFAGLTASRANIGTGTVIEIEAARDARIDENIFDCGDELRRLAAVA